MDWHAKSRKMRKMRPKESCCQPKVIGNFKESGLTGKARLLELQREEEEIQLGSEVGRKWKRKYRMVVQGWEELREGLLSKYLGVRDMNLFSGKGIKD